MCAPIKGCAQEDEGELVRVRGEAVRSAVAAAQFLRVSLMLRERRRHWMCGPPSEKLGSTLGRGPILSPASSKSS